MVSLPSLRKGVPSKLNKAMTSILKNMVVVSASIAIFISCTQEEAYDMKHYMEFEAGITTKTTVSGSDILWENGDELSIFDTNSNNRFSTLQSGTTTVFTGKAGDALMYYALYPYNLSAIYDAEKIFTTLPKVQIAREGDFAKGANLSVGRTTGKSIEMLNLCGYLKVGIKEDGKYRKVTIHTNSGEQLSGDVCISFDAESRPHAVAGTTAHPEVCLTAESGTLDKGVYYIPVLPGTYSNGLSWILEDNSGAKYAGGNEFARVIFRSQPLFLGNLDENVEFMTQGLSVNHSLSETDPEPGKSSAVIVLNTTCDDVTASVVSSTMTDVTISKIAYNKFSVQFTNPSQTPQDYCQTVVRFSATDVEPVDVTIRQNGLLRIAFKDVTYTPALPESMSATASTHSFSVADREYSISRYLCYQKNTSYLMFNHYDSNTSTYGYIQFPAIADKTLRKVYVNFRGNDTHRKCSFEVRDAEGYQYSNYLKREDITTAITDSLILGEKNEPAAGVAYRLIGTLNVNCQINSFDLVYE